MAFSLPGDPAILVSFLNTQLRDRYSSLADLAEDMDIDQEDIIRKLREAGYRYNETQNRIS